MTSIGALFCSLAILLELKAGTLRLDRLRCESLENPEGIEAVAPRLSWELTQAPGERQQKQSAYRILAATELELLEKEKGDLWDSGKVASTASAHVAYGGRTLPARSRVYWKVRVWDKTGAAGPWSTPASWSMGLLSDADWQASWIFHPAGAATNTQPSPPRNGFHSALANRADASEWLTITLAEPAMVDRVRLFGARPYDFQPDTPGFLFPLRFRVQLIPDGVAPDDAKGVTVFDASAEDYRNPGTNAVDIAFPPARAQAVRLQVTKFARRDSTNYAFALSEMEVFSGGTNQARGAAITASSSIDDGGWAKANLVDGRFGGERAASASQGTLPATVFRREFSAPGSIRRAVLYASALGVYEARLNGQRIGDRILAPEWTNYRKRTQYQVYDVTRLVRPGTNVLLGEVGEGWYAGRLMVTGRFAYGANPAFLAQLEIETADGSVTRVVTDGDWRCSLDGPVTGAGIYDGESYDARKEFPGLHLPGFMESGRGWTNAVVAKARVGGARVWQSNEPIRVSRELSAREVREPKPGIYVFDLGQNMVGWARLSAHGQAGTTVRIQYAEALSEDGRVYTANLRGAAQRDTFIPATTGGFVYEPRFTYHGFRFVEVEGLVSPPVAGDLVGRVFHSSAPEVGTFECSDSSLNRLMTNILWTQRANLMSSPNDCPQRDERFGWMGDIQSFSQTGMFQMDLEAFFHKWLQDVRDDQAVDGRFPDFAPHAGDPARGFSGAPAWADAGVFVPWQAYLNYGDPKLLADQFEAARRWVDFVAAANTNGLWLIGRGNDYNDWLNGDWIKKDGWPSKGASVPNELLATAFFARSTEIVAGMARVLGREREMREYENRASRIREAFLKAYVGPDGTLKGDTQGGYALALAFDLLPETARPDAAARLVEGIRRYQGHLSTGIQTTHRAMLELSRWGQGQTAWQLITNRTFPSWQYMIDNGATTIWERWDGYVLGRGFQDAGMNSLNHWALGSVGEWVWRHVAGIHPDENAPGFERFTIAPYPGGGVRWAKATHRCIAGVIGVSWGVERDSYRLDLRIPPNTTAQVLVLSDGIRSVREGASPASQARGVRFLRMRPPYAVFQVGSGEYHFASRPPESW